MKHTEYGKNNKTEGYFCMNHTKYGENNKTEGDFCMKHTKYGENNKREETQWNCTQPRLKFDTQNPVTTDSDEGTHKQNAVLFCTF